MKNFLEPESSVFVDISNKFPTRKYEIAKFVETIISELVDGGDLSLLQTESKLACMEAVVKKVRGNDEYKSALLNEAEKQNRKTFTAFDSSFCIKEVGTKYDFSKCGHLEYDRIVLQIEGLNEKRKAIEAQIKFSTQGFYYVDYETGETYFVHPCSKTSTTQVVTTISQ